MSTWQPVPGIKGPLSVAWLDARWKGCQQVCLDVELRWKGEFPQVCSLVLMSLNIMQGHVGVELDGCTYCLD
jgi:hypothetical protein